MPRRTVQEVTVQDVQKRRNPSKHYVYIIKVSWTDGSTELIYRRYSKFFDLQMELLDKFPVEGGQKDPKRRIIPFLPGKILFRRSHIRDVAMKRLRPINEYCRALIQLPVYISQCEEVRVFFETRPEDLNPPKEEPAGKKKSGDGTSADPLLLDQYVAVTDYEKQESSEISLRVGQVVEVIEKNESGWWFVSSEDAQGWVPATCLEAQDDPDDFALPGEEEEKYSVVYPYSARDQDEIDLERGMIVEVIQKNLEGWWKIRYQGREGWAPASYLKKADIQSQKQAGGVAHASTNDLDGFSKQSQPIRETREGNQKENRLSFFSDNKKFGLRQRPPPRRDLSIPRGTNLPKPPGPPQVEEEFYTIADFQTTIPDGISFQAGVKVEVIEKNGSGWWYIQIDDQEGWAPATFIEKYKKTSNAVRPNFLAPLPNEMERLRLEDSSSSNIPGTDDSWSKPLPDEPTAASESCTRVKLRDWKSGANKSSAFSGPLPPAPVAPPDDKPALPPRKESINKSFDSDMAEKPARPDHSKPLPPKPPAPGVIVPLVAPKAAPFKADKTSEPKKEDKNKALHLRNEMGLECGHKVSAKEVKKFNLKPVPKQPPKPKSEATEEKPEAASPAVFMKPKPVIRPKPVPAAKPDPPAENKLDITNLRSKLRPSKPVDTPALGEGNNNQNDTHEVHPSAPSFQIPSMNNGKNCDESKFPPRHMNGHSQESSPPPGKPAVPPHKEVPLRPPALGPRRPPPPKKTSPSSPTEIKPPSALKDPQDPPKTGPSQLNRPPPPKPKGFSPASPSREKEDPTSVKKAIPPKPQVKSDKPGPPRDKLPPLLKEPSKEELYLAVADFDGDDPTSSFKVGTLFEVLEKNSSGWWFCKNIGEDVEGWIPSNYLSKKP
ncbi:SH3 and PX domain-containing protein 2B isoform X2 [Corythoichthys intestinalis]|uniref:SH3 and PX domain-containing protein 2B isoform X2 n=1 Tax=Corythoichthys intestinalis TaxID=161448 RepID=UPI0025A537AC|nr:SH3 and PX domain-containing protein 2B isoform X2 [Corythoichthys intestinalis]